MAILSAKNRFPFIAFFNPHQMVGTGKMQLDKLLCLTQLI